VLKGAIEVVHVEVHAIIDDNVFNAFEFFTDGFKIQIEFFDQHRGFLGISHLIELFLNNEDLVFFLPLYTYFFRGYEQPS
jgi:hypothetical protein